MLRGFAPCMPAAHTGCCAQLNFPDLQVAQGRCNLYGVVVGNSSFPEGFCQVGIESSLTINSFALQSASTCYLPISCQPSLPLKRPATYISSRPFEGFQCLRPGT